MLAQWYKPSRQFFLETNFGETFIIESGSVDAPSPILLHGSGSNSAMWTADVKEYSKNFHVFAIDIIGECDFSSESRPAFKPDIYSKWISEIIDKAVHGRTSDVDYIMNKLDVDSTLAINRYVDFASLFLNRIGDWKPVKKAYEEGLIDEIQAYAR